MTTAPKTLLLDLSRDFGGASTRVLSLLSHYPAHRAVLGALEGSPVYVEAQQRGLPVYPLARHKWDLSLLSKLKQVVQREGIMLIDSHNIQSQFWGYWAAKAAHLPLVSTLNSWYADEYAGTLKGLLYRTLERQLRPPGPIITVSASIADKLRSQGVTEQNIHIIENASALPCPTQDRLSLAKVHNLPLDAPWLLLPARLVPAKRVDRFIQTLGKIPAAVGIVVGQGPLAKTLNRQAEQLVLGPRFRMLGALAHHDTMALMAAADVVMLSSDTEGTPLSLLEAAALARPIVATAVGGIPEIFHHGQDALLVKPDSNALARAVTTLLENPIQAKQLGEQAQQRVLKRYNPEGQIQQTLNAYQHALEAWV